MPNWCDNSLHLSHEDVTKIDALEAEMMKKNDEGRSMACPFQHLRPNPSGEWNYDWSVNNWGTKWEADIIDWERASDTEMRIYFNSAWSPPTTLYEYLVEEGWQVEAIYHEPGMAYAGMFTNEDGDDYYEYSVSDKSSIDSLPSDVIDFAGLEDAHEQWLEEQQEEYLNALARTEWFPVKTKPAYVGRYEVTTKAWEFPQYCNWDGKKWSRWEGDDIKVTQWRGLVEEFTGKDYQDMMDNIVENS